MNFWNDYLEHCYPINENILGIFLNKLDNVQCDRMKHSKFPIYFHQ